MEKVLTVGVNVYGVEAFIDDCLKSLVNEDIMEKLEVLVVIDGSPDNSASIAKRYEAKYPGTFRVIEKENGGVGSAVNCAVSNAKGKYYKWLDGDDMLCGKGLADLIRIAENSDADLILTPYVPFDDKTGAVLEHNKELWLEKALGVYDLNELKDIDKYLYMHHISASTKMLKENGFKIPDRRYYVDTEYVAFCLRFAKKVQTAEKPVYLYRLGLAAQSVSYNGSRKYFDDREKVVLAIAKLYDTGAKESVSGRMKDFMIGTMNTMTEFYLCCFTDFKHYVRWKGFLKIYAKYVGDFYKVRGGKQAFLLKYFGYPGFFVTTFVNNRAFRKKEKELSFSRTDEMISEYL